MYLAGDLKAVTIDLYIDRQALGLVFGRSREPVVAAADGRRAEGSPNRVEAGRSLELASAASRRFAEADALAAEAGAEASFDHLVDCVDPGL